MQQPEAIWLSAPAAYMEGEYAMNQENKKHRKKSRVILTVICAVLAVILVVLVAATVYVEVTLGRIRRPEQQQTLSPEEMSSILDETDPYDPNFTGPTYNEGDVTAPETAPDILNGEHVINVLLVGTDTDGSYRGHSDSMILCTIDTEKKTVVMTSFLRDMYMPITGFGQSGHAQERINVSYLSGGFPMLYDTLRDNFGVVVDYGVEVNFNSFAEVIDQVGGVDITLTANEAAHLRGKGYNVQEGLNHMDGETALAHARNRTTGGSGDFARSSRQRAVIEALIDKAINMDVGSLYNLVNALIPLVVTDMTNGEIISAVRALAPIAGDLEIISQRIPADGAYQFATINGDDIILPDFDAARKLLQETIGNP